MLGLVGIVVSAPCYIVVVDLKLAPVEVLFTATLFLPLCLIPWVIGNVHLNQMDAGFRDARYRSKTRTGRTLGMVGTILWIAVFLLACLLQI